MDVFATAVSAAGCPLPDDRVVDGRDLIPYVNGASSDAPHRALFWRAQYSKAVRFGDWKLLLNERWGTAVLYDLSRDPEELFDLAPRHPEKVQELRRAIERWETGLVPPLWPRVMDFEIEIGGEVFRFAI
jgi:arylsulfatase A-like enzyme